MFRHALEAMGTRFEIVLTGSDEHRMRAVAEAALERVRECHALYSAFDPASLVSHINRSAWRSPVRVDEGTFTMLRVCLGVARATDRAFDITVGPLLRAMGLRGGPAGDTRAALELVGSDGLVLDPGERTVRFLRPGMEIDLGGVAKGYALDLAAGVLRELGVERALVHGGTSSVVAIGTPPVDAARAGVKGAEREGNRGWMVRLAGAAPEATVVLRDASLSVSSPRARAVGRGGAVAGGEGEGDGGMVGHVVDPRDGRALDIPGWTNPAASGGGTGFGLTAACVHSSGLIAEAWSTASLVLAARAARGNESGASTPTRPEGLATLIDRGGTDVLRWQLRGDWERVFVLPGTD